MQVYDSKSTDAITYDENSFYIFDRGYNTSKVALHSVNAYYVVRGKKNNSFKPMMCKGRFKPESSILMRFEELSTGMKRTSESSFSSRTHWISDLKWLLNFITTDGRLNSFSSG